MRRFTPVENDRGSKKNPLWNEWFLLIETPHSFVCYMSDFKYFNPAIQFLPKNDIGPRSGKLTIQISLKVIQFYQNFIRNKIKLFAWKLGEWLSRERSIFGTRWARNSCGAPIGLFTSWKKGFWTLIGDFQMLHCFTEQLNFSNLSWLFSFDWLIAPNFR